MPCYKGENYIVESIRTVEREFCSIANDFELVVVIDGFIDKGYDYAKLLEKEYENLIVTGYEKNRGKGHALLHGFKKCRGKYIAFLDSDLDYDPKALKWFLDIALHQNADLVIGNRKDEKSTYVYPLVRKISSWAFNRFVKIVFPEIEYPDTQAGIKLMKRGLAEKYFEDLEKQPDLQGFILDIFLLLTAKKANMKIFSSYCIFEMKSTTIGTGGNLIKTAYRMGSEVLTLKRRYKKTVNSLA
jgi:glycosyltransferase involved in cell wall biosynthesis